MRSSQARPTCPPVYRGAHHRRGDDALARVPSRSAPHGIIAGSTLNFGARLARAPPSSRLALAVGQDEMCYHQSQSGD